MRITFFPRRLPRLTFTLCIMLLAVALVNRAPVAFTATTTGCATPSFAPASNFATGDTPISVITDDFNRDGKLDLATANVDSDTVSVLLGDGAAASTRRSTAAWA